MTVAAVICMCDLYMQAFNPGIGVYTPCAQALRANVACRALGRQQGAGTFTIANSSGAANAFCITLLQASPVAAPSFDFSQLQNEASISWVLPRNIGGALCPLMRFSSLLPPPFILVFSTLILAPLAPCGCTCVTLVSPSGPHWGLPLSSADNYCHLHIARCDKHLALPAASCGTATLV